MDYEARRVEGGPVGGQQGHEMFIGTIDVRIRIVYKDSWYTPGGVPQFVVDMDQSDDFIS